MTCLHLLCAQEGVRRGQGSQPAQNQAFWGSPAGPVVRETVLQPVLPCGLACFPAPGGQTPPSPAPQLLVPEPQPAGSGCPRLICPLALDSSGWSLAWGQVRAGRVARAG